MMDDKHKNILRVNRTKLLEEMYNFKNIIDKLIEKGTLNNSLKDNIMYAGNPTDIKRELLDCLPRRGPGAFEEFYEALIESDNGHVADILKPEQAKSRKAQEQKRRQVHRPIQESHPDDHLDDDLPAVWPDENYNPLVVKVQEASGDPYMLSNFRKSAEPRSTVYSMQKQPRGLVLIISNEDFSQARKNEEAKNLEDRKGSETDATSLDVLFQQLHFKTVIHKNQTKEGIMKIVQDLQEDLKQEQQECFICFLLSHGTGGGVFGVDGKVAEVKEITTLFDNEHCKPLAGKPKLFFIQACRGNKSDMGVVLPPDQQEDPQNDDVRLREQVKDRESLLKSFNGMAVSQPTDTVPDACAEMKVPKGADIFVAFATTPDYVSFRNTQRGTWFVQAITYIFQRFAYRKDLSDMMTKVNLLVTRGNMMQVTQCETTLRKSLYFFPGLNKNDNDIQPVQASD
ncbi:caspase-2-like [Haliotis rubra]|uniref:caspase-2-like n=1 Tax=Haliotis rubra TaxID=36100 RepID=UPI001EE52686|nr:caspase-2-like [Haliotis rubra]XP_046547506.1 caspase-2-like [Haliotis rubra]